MGQFAPQCVWISQEIGPRYIAFEPETEAMSAGLGSFRSSTHPGAVVAASTGFIPCSNAVSEMKLTRPAGWDQTRSAEPEQEDPAV